MTQKSAVKPKSDATAKVVVFGIDGVNWMPRAAWFPKDKADAAQSAAKQLRLNVAEVTNGIAAGLVAKIPQGRVHAPGAGMVPPISEDLYETIVAGIGSSSKAGQNAGNTTGPSHPGTREGLKPGDLVLIHDSLVAGWFEGIVVDRTGDKVAVRWRDYAGHPLVTLPITAVALAGTPSI